MNFTEFKLNEEILAGVKGLGYETATPIQEKAIPPILAGLDVIGLAQTGTGKTAAFALPLLQRLMGGPKGQPRGLILAPTRELVEQIRQSIDTLGLKTGLRTTTIYGGVNFQKQLQALRRGVDIIIACPGRLLDHITVPDRILQRMQMPRINLSKVEVLILDEADHMFDLGFREDIAKILKQLPKPRQNLLFSATMSTEIRTLAEEILRDPVSVKIGESAPTHTVTQTLYPVSEALKTELLVKLLQINAIASALIFTRTKHRAKRLAEHLDSLGYSASSFQGNLSQSKRQITLSKFRAGKLNILVATDIAARGIDISHISHVINFDMPNTTDAYTHRIGRTGRASKLGAAFTLITHADRGRIRSIERLLKKRLEECTVPGFDYQAKANAPSELTTPDRPRHAYSSQAPYPRKPKPRVNHQKSYAPGGKRKKSER